MRDHYRRMFLWIEQMFTDEEEEKVLSDQSSLYSMLELAWHLCEILFVEVLPGGCLVHQLLEWVRWHNKYTDDIVQVCLCLGANVRRHNVLSLCVYLSVCVCMCVCVCMSVIMIS